MISLIITIITGTLSLHIGAIGAIIAVTAALVLILLVLRLTALGVAIRKKKQRVRTHCVTSSMEMCNSRTTAAVALPNPAHKVIEGKEEEPVYEDLDAHKIEETTYEDLADFQPRVKGAVAELQPSGKGSTEAPTFPHNQDEYMNATANTETPRGTGLTESQPSGKGSTEVPALPHDQDEYMTMTGDTTANTDLPRSAGIPESQPSGNESAEVRARPVPLTELDEYVIMNITQGAATSPQVASSTPRSDQDIILTENTAYGTI